MSLYEYVVFDLGFLRFIYFLSNLLYVTYNIHKLIHSTEKDIIYKYIEMGNLDKKALNRLSLLGKKVGNHVI